MRVLFKTHYYGDIEVDQRPGEQGQVYFYQDDFGTVVSKDGSFKDMRSTPFNVIWPTSISQEAILEVTTPRQLSRAIPER